MWASGLNVRMRVFDGERWDGGKRLIDKIRLYHSHPSRASNHKSMSIVYHSDETNRIAVALFQGPGPQFLPTCDRSKLSESLLATDQFLSNGGYTGEIRRSLSF
ncbi:hypothetical protein CIHG_04174 [Coccidioides immitis H538.4]|uniref:Uncharacterized protein n=3 Tax=Coccidioides immitis TaxID=5501 RepID=A0A0J8QLP8_COCIT|nr:hypothetical protein CIRG_04565 [Coccidioides immitis RMSCC 2394]KMU73351.1 hypothetical protein CISG_10081 [Coccidioides immitis RMSCC 3703]KMU86385.1 hypothetical protein CIHG_04174 [Coccidioides immitis H538.4]